MLILIVLALGALAAAMAGILVYAGKRWNSGTEKLRARLEATRRPMGTNAYDTGELIGMPEPVQRYFRAALTGGQRVIAAVDVEHIGTFNPSATREQWKPFTSTQRVITQRPGFDWDAGIRMMPGITVRVHDAYIAGEGLLHATLFGLVPLANLRGTPEIARGELMRFLAEAAWYPTALLPSQGVCWTAVDDASAKVTLRDGQTEATLLFRFDEHGLIDSVRADARGRIVAGTVVQTPWEGRWSNYEVRDGMRIPTRGEVAWVLPDGPKP
jgi:hypothetical protein